MKLQIILPVGNAIVCNILLRKCNKLSSTCWNGWQCHEEYRGRGYVKVRGSLLPYFSTGDIELNERISDKCKNAILSHWENEGWKGERISSYTYCPTLHLVSIYMTHRNPVIFIHFVSNSFSPSQWFLGSWLSSSNCHSNQLKASDSLHLWLLWVKLQKELLEDIGGAGVR